LLRSSQHIFTQLSNYFPFSARIRPTYTTNIYFIHKYKELILISNNVLSCFISHLIINEKLLYSLRSIQLQGNSEKCTGEFKCGYRVIFYLSKSCRKSGLISHLYIEFTKKIHIMFHFVTNINICKFLLKNIFD